MDTVVFDGEKYVKASVLAKKFRYTADYLGQLCRAKKVDARLIGRTWFVNPQSVEVHKEKKKLRAVTEQITASKPDAPIEKTTQRKMVPPVIQNKTIKTQSNLLAKSTALRAKRLTVYYELDDETLLPTLIRKKTAPPKTLRIEHVGAKKVKILGNKNETNFQAEELPEVALSGKLAVSTYIEPKPVEDTSPLAKKSLENIDISPELDSIAKSNKPAVLKKITPPKVVAMKRISLPVVTPVVQSSVDQSVIPDTNVALAPDPMPITLSSVAPNTLVQEKVSTFVMISPLLATFLAVFVVILIFSASSTVEVMDKSYHSQIVLQVANLLEVFNH